MTKTMTIVEFVAKNNVSMFVEAVDANPHMSDDSWARAASHYRCLLRANNKRMTVYYSMGSAHTNEPTIVDVLGSLQSDATSIENARDFEDWASDFGFDTDSIKALKTFKVCKRQAEKLAKLLGPVAFNELLECEPA